jgi:hypothetical protein
MISFIIPTVYSSPQLKIQVTNLERCDLVEEILIIEDVPYNGMFDGMDLKKTKIIPYNGVKKYCNGGWNLGLSISKSYYYALSTDDILYSTKIIEDILHFYKTRSNLGVIGIHPVNYNKYETNRVLFYGIVEKEKLHADGGWGALMFNHKDNVMMIPEDLQHWCGDTYYLNYSKYPVYDYFGEKFFTGNDDHGTESSKILDICINDQKIYEEKYKLEKPIWKK